MVWSLTDHTYQIGELFVNTNAEEASALMEKAKTTVQDEINKLQLQRDVHKNILSDLKVQLYAKFGSNINLEAEEDWWQRPECVLCARGVQILNEYFGSCFFSSPILPSFWDSCHLVRVNKWWPIHASGFVG